MTIRAYEVERGRALAAREEAAYLRELHGIATCGLPTRFTGIHYGNAQVRESVAMRMADTYLVWAAEYDAIADQIEAGMAGMLRSTVRCPGCDLDPVGYAPHNGKGDCPPQPSGQEHDHANRDQADIEASIAGDTPWDREHAQDHTNGSTNDA